jgi:hypothetical protein
LRFGRGVKKLEKNSLDFGENFLNFETAKQKEDFRNKIADFRLQTIGCDDVIVWRLASYFSRFPNGLRASP